MKINGQKISFYKDIIKPAIKEIFTFGKNKLERSPDTDVVQVNAFINTPGIKSATFKKLLTPEFTPKTNIASNGARITTLIDKKTQKPVEAFVAKVDDGTPDVERYILMVKDKNGKIDIQNEKFKTVGETHFYIDRQNKVVSPKYELTMIDGELYEKVHSYMRADDNKKYAGIGTRLHQLRVERMLQNNLGNVQIVAEGNSFPFHYAMGYRLRPITRPVEDAGKIMHEFSVFNKKPPMENSKYLAVKVENKKQIIDFSASIENCLNDHYKNGGAPIKDFSPNMFLDKTSLEQWIEMIKKQPILY